ncbi:MULTISPECIES: short chain dehydrogenase [Streptomyces]|uniref:Short chain dehydrogenase n=2 Tax=Streptomyces rimosus subsp. rimosus TaxID=132474 RepID=L8EJH9_STRR1|nr:MULTISPECIES: short chain dehydrogenase [Streptomyces]KOG70602.1 short-chain dehydrogenase [Kitasatospora aureofaciens]MYT40907.1 short chain dehydrogenase [Streptomyces sp. SID5471]KEF05516.1 short-chain dehydrogenase [Streptomyces rimosus]KEF21348.1 short-chain dehydrogenase [Streptomyces rimosus]KOT31939.1 short-chain dehydrogenase [Streptomyces sp. NRRL WC-3701]
MKILLIGATGKLGTAVHKTLAGRGHEIVTVGRSGGDLRLDIGDPAQVTEVYDRAAERIGTLDAVVSAAGDTPFKPVAEMTAEDYAAGFRGKVLSQIELVRQGTARISARGSFTLITGVLARDPIPTGSAAAMANGAVESFVRAAAIDIAPQRVNAVSPTVVTESLPDYGAFFPGIASVGLDQVAAAYVRSVEGGQTGQVYELA